MRTQTEMTNVLLKTRKGVLCYIMGESLLNCVLQFCGKQMNCYVITVMQLCGK